MSWWPTVLSSLWFLPLGTHYSRTLLLYPSSYPIYLLLCELPALARWMGTCLYQLCGSLISGVTWLLRDPGRRVGFWLNPGP